MFMHNMKTKNKKDTFENNNNCKVYYTFCLLFLYPLADSV